MAEASRRTKIWVWVIVLTLFAGAALFAVNTLRSSMQPLGVLNDPFPDEQARPGGSEAARGAVNFLVFGEAAATHQTVSIFHLAEGRRRIDIVNFPSDSAHLSNIQDVPGTVQEVEDLTQARMEHVMLWDLEFLTELESAAVTAEAITADPEAFDADTVWTMVLQEALDIRDPGQLNTLAATLTPYVAADAGLNTGRITDLARSLRHVSPDNIASCELPTELSAAEQDALARYFDQGTPRWCAQLFE
ncbi:hypothetical protein GCM10023190_20870 [Enteractinococcus fodinae]|uniref:Cell envelope-related transcriptional attenuator domain-containing protein n=1 Tax=Enteractinococcus fodinae TaxID=684663 RepID=A0ABU2B5X1_9MICC|nr:hypothetical protein [Enteractinococcus fodinae]MDR7348153.1 hypothetical protein [Enteractinococcus fodinae]